VDTTFGTNGKIEQVYALSKDVMPDSLVCKYKYYDSDKIKSILFAIILDAGEQYIFRYYHMYEYYENGNLKSDSLGDYRDRMEKEERYTLLFQSGKIRRERIAIGKGVKGRGVGETFSWGTNWKIVDKVYNEFGELIYKEKGRVYWR
jgi:hypothetical protein